MCCAVGAVTFSHVGQPSLHLISIKSGCTWLRCGSLVNLPKSVDSNNKMLRIKHFRRLRNLLYNRRDQVLCQCNIQITGAALFLMKVNVSQRSRFNRDLHRNQIFRCDWPSSWFKKNQATVCLLLNCTAKPPIYGCSSGGRAGRTLIIELVFCP